jgi:lipid-binding SYLF domain-containing protein
MENRKRLFSVETLLVAILAVGMLLASYAPAMATNREKAQLLVDRARITLNDFMNDSNYVWFHEHINRARGVLIFPEVIKGGFIWGGSGGTGVLLVRNEKTGTWSEPAFYTIGSVTFGLQIGGEASQVVMLAMTRKAVDSLLSSSVKLGAGASVALGPVGGGAKANAGVPNVTADFISFAKSKGLYAGLNLAGSVVAVRDSLNEAYYQKPVSPADILVSHAAYNSGANRLRETLKRAA